MVSKRFYLKNRKNLDKVLLFSIKDSIIQTDKRYRTDTTLSNNKNEIFNSISNGFLGTSKKRLE